MRRERRRAEAEPQFLLLAADLWETGGIGTAMRTMLCALADLHGADNCFAMTLRGRTKQQTVPARILDAGFVTSAQRIPLWPKVRFAVAVCRAAGRRGSLMTIIGGHPQLAALTWLAHATSGRPYVAWVYGKESWAPLGRLRRAALRRANAVLAITSFTAQAATNAQKLDPGRVRVVRLCLPPWHTGPAPVTRRSDEVVLCVARLDREDRYKGVDMLVKAWPRVLAARPQTVLKIVGDGNDRDHIAGIVEELGVGGSVRLLGTVSHDQLTDLYRRASLFALPGRASMGPEPEGEGFGIVFVEAQAAGLPVIAGRAAGAQEAVCDGSTGLLVDPEDPDDIASAITRLLADEALRTRMGEAAVAFVNADFSYDRFRTDIARAMQASRCGP